MFEDRVYIGSSCLCRRNNVPFLHVRPSSHIDDKSWKSCEKTRLRADLALDRASSAVAIRAITITEM
jgi:hypothetical protein